MPVVSKNDLFMIKLPSIIIVNSIYKLAKGNLLGYSQGHQATDSGIKTIDIRGQISTTKKIALKVISLTIVKLAVSKFSIKAETDVNLAYSTVRFLNR